MTAEAETLTFGRRKRRWIANVLLIERLGVSASGSVASFAGLSLPSSFRTALGVRFKGVVRILSERVANIFVTRQASVGADVSCLRSGKRRAGE